MQSKQKLPQQLGTDKLQHQNITQNNHGRNTQLHKNNQIRSRDIAIYTNIMFKLTRRSCSYWIEWLRLILAYIHVVHMILRWNLYIVHNVTGNYHTCKIGCLMNQQKAYEQSENLYDHATFRRQPKALFPSCNSTFVNPISFYMFVGPKCDNVTFCHEFHISHSHIPQEQLMYVLLHDYFLSSSCHRNI